MISRSAWVGLCPECGSGVYSYRDYFQCTRRANRKCDFFIRRSRLAVFGKESITDPEMAMLLKEQVIPLKNLRKKNGERFSCGGVLTYDEDWGWTIGFTRQIPTSSPNMPPRVRRISGTTE